MGHTPRFFSEDDVKSLVSLLVSGSSCTELGVLEAIVNLLKAEPYRAVVWSQPGVQPLIFTPDANKPSPIVYKSVFAIWMLSFEESLIASLKSNDVAKKIKNILTISRVEKVIRLCLTVLQNFLTRKAVCQAVCEDIVEEGVLEAVQQLEYEKWRDTELYEDIRVLVQLISSEVKELSNFDRYMRELESGTLSWGFIHSSKFFGENVMKFEHGEFKALKLLANLLSSDSVTTLAVACHDIGEFVSLHPLGKKQVARLGVKERVMELMSSDGQNYREVRREALLCCQKIMLNKWQDVAAVEKMDKK
jgi:V-type H+-transporting ATPase subunit H